MAKLGLDGSGSASSGIQDAYTGEASLRGEGADCAYLRARVESNFAKVNEEFARQGALIARLRQELEEQRGENAVLRGQMADVWGDVVKIIELTLKNQKQVKKLTREAARARAASRARFGALSRMLARTDTFKAYFAQKAVEEQQKLTNKLFERFGADSGVL